MTQINPLSMKMAKTTAWKSHRPVSPILQVVKAVWSVGRYKELKEPTTVHQTQPTGLNYMWYLSGS